MDSLLPPPENAGMPWSKLAEAGWKLLHVHHHRPGQLTAYIESDKEFLLMKGPDNAEFWTRLEVKAGIAKRTALPKKEVTKADPRHTPFINEWGHAYKAHYGRAYVFNGAADGSQLKRLLQNTNKTVEELTAVAKDAWTTAQMPFSKDTKRASTIAGFCSGWNEINTEIERMNPKELNDTSHVL